METTAPMTAQQMLREKGLDWKVGLWDSPARCPLTGRIAEHKGSRKIVRLDNATPFATVTGKYKLFQNSELGEFMGALAGEGLAEFHTAGALNGGERVWMQMKLPRECYAVPGDRTECFILGAISHNGSGSVCFMGNTNRLSCSNQLRRTLGRGEGIRIRHTNKIRSRLADARRAVGLIARDLDVYQEEIQAMARVKMGRSDVEKYVKTLTRANGQPYFPTESPPEISLEDVLEATEAREDIGRELLSGYYAATERIAKKNKAILETILANHDCDPASGTAWGAYNGVSEYADHGMGFRGQGEDKANGRLNSAWFGAGHELKQAAFQAALEMAR